jgi:hypothetical protein
MFMIEIEQITALLADEKHRPKKYEDWNDVRRTMFVHTRGKNPENILTARRPNEDPDVQKYRLSIYEPITKGSMNRAIDKLFRIFQNANFSIQVSDELNTYLSEHKFDGQFFYSYIQKFVVRRMIEDPNGYLVWIPVGPGLTDPTIKVDVEPILIMSNDIKVLNHNLITWRSNDEYSMIRENGKMVEHGLVYYTLTDTAFFRHEQFGQAIDKKFNTVIVYEHNIGQCPAVILGGDLTDDNFFDSYFSAFVPFANEAIRQYSDWTAVMTTSAFPYREEVAETCDAKGCRDGVVYNSEHEEHETCSKCKGSGRIISRSPFGVFLREKGNAALGTDTGSSEPMIRFISPPVDIIKYSGEAWETLLRKAEESLHLNTIDEAQSGTAKQIDREDSFSQLTKISNNLFDEIIFKSLVFIEQYRNVVNPMDPIIVKPISFSMKTEDDLIEELNKLTDKNAPIAFLVESTKDLARKRFSGNKTVSRLVEILVSYDPIYHLNTKDKQMLLASGTIRKEDLLKSLFAYKTLTAMVADNGTEFLEQPLSVIFAELDAKLAPILSTYIPKTVIDINADSADAGTVDTELARQRAEAQANLKGTVGGVQGILSIQQSVSQGVTKRDAAISLLETIYGFDSETANRLLGDPIEIPPPTA